MAALSMESATTLTDDLRRPNQLDHFFFSSLSDFRNAIMPSSSGVRKLPDPSEDAEEPGVSAGRCEVGVRGAVSTGVFGALEKRV